MNKERKRAIDDMLALRINGKPLYREDFMPSGERVAIDIRIEKILNDNIQHNSGTQTNTVGKQA